MELRAATPSKAWYDVVRLLHTTAPIVQPRGLKAAEYPARFHLIVERPHGFVENPGRDFNHTISLVEGLSLVGQCSVPEWQVQRVKALGAFMNRSVFRGAYGPRVEGSLDDVIELLQRDPDSRQAVISIYNGQRDLGRWSASSKSGDVPCTVAIQFLVRYRFTVPVLEMWVVMRSNDAWRGLPYDMGQFMILQHAVAQALGLPVGEYAHSVGSMHLYEADWSAATKLVEPDDEVFGPYMDPLLGESFDFTEIASRARLLLAGKGFADQTPFEDYATGRLINF